MERGVIMKAQGKKSRILAQEAARETGIREEMLEATRAMEYVSHPSFTKNKTEAELFGPKADKIKVHAWTHFPQVPEELQSIRSPRSTLSANQETRMFLQYNFARFRLAQLAEHQQQSSDHNRGQEMRLWYERSQQLRSDIISTNMALVLAMAKRTRIPNVDFAEIISEGNLALLRSVEKFDVSRGFKFSTYACRAILKSFNRLATKTGKYYERFPAEYDPEMEKSDEDQRRHAEQQENSIDDLHEVLEQNAAHLSETEMSIIKERFGLNEQEKSKTLAQVGQIVGLTTERVRQIQFKALHKLKRAMNEHYTAA